jgi:hypothetical protein
MIRARTRAWAGLLGVACVACAHRPPSPPSELVAATDPRCPLPLIWPSPDRTPARLRIRNATSDTLSVVIDRCFHYTSVATLAPGASAEASLPRPLIGFPEGIRFHALIESQARFVGTWHVAPVAGPSLELVLDTATRARDASMPYRLEQGTVRLPPALHQDDSGKPYLMLPELADGGFLIWSCGHGRRWLSLSTSVKLPADTVDVATRFDDGSWSEEQRWPVLRSITDAALAPERSIDSLAVGALRARMMNVRVVMRRYPAYNGRRPPPSTTTFAFPTEGFAGMIGGVGCFREIVPKKH